MKSFSVVFVCFIALLASISAFTSLKTSPISRHQTHLNVLKIKHMTRVQLLEDVPAIGKTGEIVSVNLALWLNMLQPAKSAKKVTDKDLERMERRTEEAKARELEEANTLLKLVSGLPRISIRRKVGNENKLFGSVTSKIILNSILSSIPPTKLQETTKTLDKYTPIVEIHEHVEVGGKKAKTQLDITKGVDIRKAGLYKVGIKIHSNMEQLAYAEVHIEPEVTAAAV